MTSEESADGPSLTWRTGSSIVMGLAGAISRTFLLVGQRLTVHGLEDFLSLLDERKDVDARQRGLITVSNHLSILDDPLMWGALPYKYHWNPRNHRWGLGSHDLIFQKSVLCTFFGLGQVLPTHRLAHSKYGGLFQPTTTQVIRLLSTPRPDPTSSTEPQTPHSSNEVDLTHHPAYSIPDPFTSPNSPYFYTSPEDPYAYKTPTYHPSYNEYAWVHIFPEGRIHQHPALLMRYHKWGVGRFILEGDPAPLLVPVWIEGFQNIMHESRQFPRMVPRVGKDVSVSFGSGVDTDHGPFGDLRARWRHFVARERMACLSPQGGSEQRRRIGGYLDRLLTMEPLDATQEELEEEASDHSLESLIEAEHRLAERLKYAQEAVQLREECTMRVREELLRVRRERGWEDEDPKARLVDTWKQEGKPAKREGQMEDGSWVKDT